jgi:hypothetical protein
LARRSLGVLENVCGAFELARFFEQRQATCPAASLGMRRELRGIDQLGRADRRCSNGASQQAPARQRRAPLWTPKAEPGCVAVT